MRDIDPGSEESQRAAADNDRYIGGLQLQEAFNRQREVDTIVAMGERGGSFVKALSVACFRADPDNLRRIKTAFPEIWEKYSQMSEVTEGEG